MAIFSLALAVGANLVVFTIVKAIWLRPNVIRQSDRVVAILGDDSNSGSGDSFMFGPAGIDQILDRSTAFETVAGEVLTSGQEANFLAHIRINSVQRNLEALGVTWRYFDVLGVGLRGRSFVSTDDGTGAEPVAIVSDRLWRELGAREDVIGSVVPASPVPVRIVGVAAAGFEGARLGQRVDLWIPTSLDLRASALSAFDPATASPGLTAIGRLRGGVSAADAERLILANRPASDRMRSYRVVPLSQIFGSPTSRTIVMRPEQAAWLGVVSALLVLAGGCATLLALVLVHYERRRQELSVRLALGASRLQLIRQLTLEISALIASGTVAATLLCGAALRLLPAVSLPGGIDLRRLDLTVDWRVAGVGVIASALVAAVAAWLPVRRFSRADLARNLVTAHATDTAGSHRLRRVLLAGHVAATIVVLIAAGLFVRTIAYGLSEAPRFDASRTLFVDLQEGPAYRPRMRTLQEHDAWERQAGSKRLVLNEQLIAAIRQLPGVEAISAGPAPIGPDPARGLLFPQTETVGGREHHERFVWLTGDAHYLSTLGVRIVEGRGLTDADANHWDLMPVVINARFARQLFPDGSAVGQVVQMGSYKREVVGVAANSLIGSIAAPDADLVLQEASLADRGSSELLPLVIRSAAPELLIEPVRRTIAVQMPDAPRVDISTGRELLARDLARERVGAWFFSGIGLIAFALGVGSVFGLVAYLADSRRREFGVRLALGATARDLIGRATWAGVLPVAAGAGVGLIAAGFLSRFAASLIYGVSRLDALTYATTAGVMLAAATIAAAIASWRIRRIAPLDALRAE